jgi:hypothetical protein
MKNFDLNKKTVMFIFTLIVGLIILYPTIDFYPALATGDHGRDFYAYEATMNGAVPYIDYWWVYGPFMPYVYGFFLKLFGTSMLSVLFTKAIIIFASGLFVFSSMTLVTGPVIAFLAAVWFYAFQPEFFYTFNHAGGILAALSIFYLLTKYLLYADRKYLYFTLPAVFILSLIKVNFGIVSIALVLIVAYINDAFKKINPSKKLLYFCFLIALPLAVFLTYFLLLKDLPLYAVRQCLPYLDADQPSTSTFFTSMQAFADLLKRTLSPNTPSFWIGLLTALSTGLIITKFKTIKNKGQIFLFLFASGLAFILFLHEYIKSAYTYRAFWAVPFAIIFIFTIIHAASTTISRYLRIMIYVFVSVIIVINIYTVWSFIGKHKSSSTYLNHPKGKIFIGNEPQWKETVLATAKYLENNLQPGESFFALPYDVIFYYLTGRPSPTRQLIFFDHINIPPEQEEKIIAELEKNKIKFVVMSNRVVSGETGLGHFGVTYCPLISKYIENNFTPVSQIGLWGVDPGWSYNYGTLIWARK